MKNSISLSIAIRIFFLFAMTSCEKKVSPELQQNEEIHLMNSNTTEVNYSQTDGPTVLGRKKNNPYTLENMEAAKKALELRNIYSPISFSVKSTHLYVKFTPKNEQELEVLNADTALNLFDTPMDYEKLEVGNWYRETGLLEDIPTPQYAAVPYSYTFPAGIDYETITPLYLPEEDKILLGEHLTENEEYLEAITQEAFSMVGENLEWYNPYEYDPVEQWLNTPASVNGKIQIFDTRLNQYIPLQGVKITANRWFTTHVGYTNAVGDYRLDGWFLRPADFAIKFERSGFAIKKTMFQNAYASRVNQSNNHWDFAIADGMSRMYGHMFRAAFRYYYGDIAGLPRPGQPTVSLGGLVSFSVNQGIIGSNSNNAGCMFGQGVNFIIAPSLFVARNKNDGTEFNSDEIFSTTIHEIAHSSHYNTLHRDITDFIQVNSKVRESWAVGVEWLITGIEYKQIGLATNYGDWNYHTSPETNYPNDQAYQWYNNTLDNKYTSLFINLVDDYNEFGQPFIQRPTGIINDQVSGYSLGNIQILVIPHVITIADLQSWISSAIPNNPTSSQLPTLFSYY